ncbi:MAG: sigma-70 family RNA polymerase sigma factor [Anaerolineales bacterium]|nr:sigma-70 family RNA polymerase sigma factor [Anaerolineales bacterium]MCB9127926.1 sigma-70 family RNA polymerase sigma factor [Ardenticatenales bacterium]MCB9171688.1 sigma-70 family RNA polymerase sigma factor [Ardenticatenales bacterium]
MSIVAELPLNYIGDMSQQSGARHVEFEQLFDAHWMRLYRLLLRVVGDPDQADELALDTFWALHDQRGQIETDAIGAWLYRVAMNKGLNALRARQRRARYEAEAGHLHLTQTVRNPITEVERADERAAVRTVLLEMKGRDARLLFLRHSGFSYAELAEVIEVAPGSVGTLLARAEKEFERRYRRMMTGKGEEA